MEIVQLYPVMCSVYKTAQKLKIWFKTTYKHITLISRLAYHGRQTNNI